MMILLQHPMPHKWRGGEGARVKLSYLLMTRFDFDSVKHPTAVNDNNDGRAVLCRSEIDHDCAQISLLYHFRAVGVHSTSAI